MASRPGVGCRCFLDSLFASRRNSGASPTIRLTNSWMRTLSSKSRCRRVRLAVNLEDFAHEREAMAGRVLTVSRLTVGHEYKGVDMLLEAWPEVVALIPEAELVVVGDGDDRPRLEELARRWGCSESVYFLGRLPDSELRDEYRRAMLFALPGREELGSVIGGEGFGIVFLEAAAAGLPVLAGASGGSREAVVDGVTGCLLRPGATASEVAEAIVELLTDTARSNAMGIAGKRWVSENYSLERFATELDHLLCRHHENPRLMPEVSGDC